MEKGKRDKCGKFSYKKTKDAKESKNGGGGLGCFGQRERERERERGIKEEHS